MRKFKFVGTEKESFDYNRLSESGRPVYGTVYNETDMIYGGSTVLHWAEHSKFSHEWQEVFDTLDDKITELKEMAKSQGMDCEVVLKEAPKKIEVKGIHSGGSSNSDINWNYSFDFEINNYDRQKFGAKFMRGDVLSFLAKQLETYLNENK